MRRSRWLSLFAFAALSACGTNSATAPKTGLKVLNCAKAVTYTVGQSVSGSLASGDCTDPSGSGRADYYQFTLASAGPLSITVTTTTATQSVINAVLTPDGTTQHFAYTSASGKSTVGGNFAAGTYIAIVAASENNQNSDYTLTSSTTLPVPFDCPAISPIPLGATISGSFSATDCKDPDAVSPADYYSFTMSAQGPITFQLTPSSDTAYIAVGDEDSNVYAVDIADPTSPGIVSGTLRPGRYIAFVAAGRPDQTGSYSLQSSATLTAVSKPDAASPMTMSPWTPRRVRRW